MKKFFSLVLALVMALSLTTVAWGAIADTDAAKIGDTGYATLADAVADVAVGGTATITLLKSHSGAGIFLDDADNKTITIDFATYTYTCTGPAVGSAGTATQAFHLEENNTVKMMNGTVTSNCADVKMLVQNYCDLTLENMKLDGTNLSGTGRYTLSNNAGNVVIEDTTITAAADGVAFDSYDYSAGGYTTPPTVTVKGTSVVNGKVESAGGELVVEAGTFNGEIAVTDADDVSIKGGTFSTDVSAYVDADSGFTNNGDGTFSVAVKSAGSATYDLYEGDGDIYLEDVYRTKFAAKKLTKTQAGQVAGWDIEGTFYVEINKSEATNGDYYLTNHGKDKAILFLREAANHGAYTLTGKEYSNFGDDDCGEWTYDPDTTDMYVDSDGNYYVGGGVEYMLVGKTVVGVAAANDAYVVDHSMEGVYDKNDKLVSVKCSVCGATGKFYEDAADAPIGADVEPFGNVGYYVLNKVAVKPSTETKVESAETFDAGIAMYVGMSVMAAAGSVVVLKKRED